jgi:hypothetical protein
MTSLPETITNVTETVDDILHVFEEKQIQEEYKKSHSFYSFLLHFTLNVIYVVEELMKDTSGSIKKYIVIKVLESIVSQFFPSFLDLFNENIDDIIETLIESFYRLEKYKGNNPIDCCLPCFPTLKN